PMELITPYVVQPINHTPAAQAGLTQAAPTHAAPTQAAPSQAAPTQTNTPQAATPQAPVWQRPNAPAATAQDRNVAAAVGAQPRPAAARAYWYPVLDWLKSQFGGQRAAAGRSSSDPRLSGLSPIGGDRVPAIPTAPTRPLQ